MHKLMYLQRNTPPGVLFDVVNELREHFIGYTPLGLQKELATPHVLVRQTARPR